MSGEAQAALGPLDEARTRFQLLADAGNRGAAQKASVCLTERADALLDLGRLDEAAAAYEEAIKLAQQRGDPRDVAVGRFQLGTVRLLQSRYPEALRLTTRPARPSSGWASRRVSPRPGTRWA